MPLRIINIKIIIKVFTASDLDENGSTMLNSFIILNSIIKMPKRSANKIFIYEKILYFLAKQIKIISKIP